MRKKKLTGIDKKIERKEDKKRVRKKVLQVILIDKNNYHLCISLLSLNHLGKRCRKWIINFNYVF